MGTVLMSAILFSLLGLSCGTRELHYDYFEQINGTDFAEFKMRVRKLNRTTSILTGEVLLKKPVTDDFTVSDTKVIQAVTMISLNLPDRCPVVPQSKREQSVQPLPDEDCPKVGVHYYAWNLAGFRGFLPGQRGEFDTRGRMSGGGEDHDIWECGG